MTLNELANIAEVFGMLVVSVTLVFLTIQMRQNTRAMRSTTYHSVNEMALAIYTPIVASDDLADLLLRGPNRCRNGSIHGPLAERVLYMAKLVLSAACWRVGRWNLVGIH